MSDETRTPEVIYDGIVTGAKHPKSKKAIQNIKTVCDELDADGIAISVTRVGNRTKDKEGGPTAPSLRNNKEYVAYVQARAFLQSLPSVGQNQTVGSYRTNDPETNAVLYMLEAQRDAAERKLRCVTKSLSNSADFDLNEFLKQSRLSLASLPVGQMPPPEPKQTNGRLHEIIAKLLDPKHMEPFGLILENGRIKSPERNSRVLLDKSDVQVLRDELEKHRKHHSAN